MKRRPKLVPMDLRTALRLEREGVRTRTVETEAERRREQADWDSLNRARAILDAMVETREAHLRAEESGGDGADVWEAQQLEKRLRALELGLES